MKRRLWQIFGPVVLAALLVIGVLLAPLPSGRIAKDKLAAEAVSLSPNVLGGARVKQQAQANGYVPFFGSSELARMDPFHPSTLAAKYHRAYRPLLLGDPGTQSLVHFVDDQSQLAQLKGKKAVLIVSMQWFTKQGQIPAAFDMYYSPLQLSLWLLRARGSEADRYAARRLLKMDAPAKSRLDRQALYQIAAGGPVSGWVRPALQARLQMLRNEDRLFSRFTGAANWHRIEAGEKQLPSTDDPAVLNRLATQIAKQHTRHNRLGIDDRFFRERLGHGKLKALRGSQRHFEYRLGPEYGDFELLLQEFAKNHTTVQFVIPPINARWAAYTGLSVPNYEQAVAKLKYQLRSQGFTHVLDLSKDGNQPYFMQDTIHLGWRGWLAVDHTVAPFLTQPQPAEHHRLNGHFFGRAWANSTEVPQ
ncbi:D-alanyl-lipoteichoic acid biosynthesis protein DltD [Lacticaseibacillus jixianensis]|uniref:Protein DltD n=1 Tax=Lacticaseibacillus jixianensis TaxID=2486012 RepID=A0ABW4BA93_9LACO|nr:D-alanyl-lipoteichoic acid biosynthesis protein DltD [Lacticaseibacillus jixianensis]